MKKFHNYIYLYGAAALLGLSALSCSGEAPEAPAADSRDVVFQVKVSGGVSVQAGTRAGEEDGNSIFDRFPVGVDFREGKSRIRVCSVDRSSSSANYMPDYNNPFTDMDNPTRYHEYKCRTRREYEEYSDFVSYEGAIALKWDEIDQETGERKPSGNILRTNTDGGYYLFAAMYPYTYDRPVVSRESGETGESGDVLTVNEDQTYMAGEEYYAQSLLVNDIRLCQKMFGYDHFGAPIRLDFFHSLCMLVVNVKVPLYHESDGLGFKTEDILKAWPPAMAIENVGLSYEPMYGIEYDKDDAVTVRVPDNPITGDIQMFHTPNFSNPDITEGFNPEDSIYLGEEDYEGVKVPVVWMQFCAILPYQQLTDANTDVNIHFTIAGKPYRCYLSRVSEPVKLEQGHVTIVTMYIPRGESDPVLVGARLKDWEQKRTPVVSLQ